MGFHNNDKKLFSQGDNTRSSVITIRVKVQWSLKMNRDKFVGKNNQ